MRSSNKLCLLSIIVLALLMAFACVGAQAETFPESPHEYENNMDQSWEYTQYGATRLNILFSSDTQVAAGDYIYLYNAADAEVGKYTGQELAGQLITVNGGYIRIRLTSNESLTAYGFRITDISAASTPSNPSSVYVIEKGQTVDLNDIDLTGYTWIINYGTITGGTADKLRVDNYGSITGGEFYAPSISADGVMNYGTITEGSFYSSGVTNQPATNGALGSISGGLFSGPLSAGGTYAPKVTVTAVEDVTAPLGVVLKAQPSMRYSVNPVVFGNVTVVRWLREDFTGLRTVEATNTLTSLGERSFTPQKQGKYVCTITYNNPNAASGADPQIAYCFGSINVYTTMVGTGWTYDPSIRQLSVTGEAQFADIQATVQDGCGNASPIILFSSISISAEGKLTATGYDFSDYSGTNGTQVENNGTLTGGTYFNITNNGTISDMTIRGTLSGMSTVLPGIVSDGQDASGYADKDCVLTASTDVIITGSTWQWYISDTMDGEGAPIDGATGAEYATAAHGYVWPELVACGRSFCGGSRVGSWLYDYEGPMITAYYGKNPVITLPQTIGGQATNRLSMLLFRDCTTLKEITIPGCYTEIAYAVFHSCTALEKVVFESGVKVFGDNTFYGCTSLTDVTLPETVTTIGEGMFQECYALKGVALPSKITAIGSGTFNFCKLLSSITIPSDVTSIGYSAFSGCKALKSIDIPAKVTSIGDYAFDACSSLETITLPIGVTKIGYGMFSTCEAITTVTFSGNIESLGTNAFYHCYALKTITLPESLTTIGVRAFYSCNALSKLSVPSKVTALSEDAFYGCTFSEGIYLSNNIAAIDTPIDGLIYASASSATGKALTNVGLGFVNTDDESEAFVVTPVYQDDTPIGFHLNKYIGGKQTVPTLPVKLANLPIMSYADGFMHGMDITALVVEEGVTAIPTNLCADCVSLTAITLPQTLLQINGGAFSGCTSLTEFTIPSGVTAIAGNVFNGCTSLSSVTVHDKVESIGDYAFFNCTSLSSLRLSSQLTSLGEGCLVQCPLTSLCIPGSLETVPPHLFRYDYPDCDTRLSYVTIEESVKTLGQFSFPMADGGRVYMPFSLEDIDNNAFIYGYNTQWERTWIFYCYEGMVAYNWPLSQNEPYILLDNKPVEDYAVIETETSYAVQPGEVRQLSAVVYPESEPQELLWSSGNEAVVTVSEAGLLTAISPGDAIVTVAMRGHETVKATIDVRVQVDATAVELINDPMYVVYNTSEDAAVRLTPANSNERPVWSVGKATIANVADGTVTGLAYGSTTLTATLANGVSDTCALVVCRPVTAVAFASELVEIPQGTASALTCNVTMSDKSCANQLVAFASSNEDIATVDKQGNVTMLGFGVARIKAVSKQNADIQASCLVAAQGYVPATGIALDKTEAAIYPAEPLTLVATITPDTATKKAALWSNSDETVATVLDGVVTALKAGSAVITATDMDGLGISASCTLTVKQYVTSIQLDKTEATMYTDDEPLTLDATILPDDATDKSLTWTSDDETVATVADGVVTPVGEGSATITAAAGDGGGASASCDISVLQDVITISVSASQATLCPGDAVRLAVSVQSTRNGAEEYVITSDAPDIVCVLDGSIEALELGNAVLTVACASKPEHYTTVPITVASQTTATLPESLVKIESEALYGTAMQCIVLSQSVESVGERAFEGCEGLCTVWIPSMTTSLATDILSSNQSAVLVCMEGSAAQTQAIQNEMPYLLYD